MSTYQHTTGKSIQESFEAYHAANPRIYELFKKYVREVVDSELRKGRKLAAIKTSAKLIINRIRWEINITTESPDEFKINDAYTSRYARLFQKDFPDYAHLFNYRDIRSL